MGTPPIGRRFLASALVLTVAAACHASLELGLYLERSPKPSEIEATYTGAKFEPRVGCYLGAFIDLDSTISQTFLDQTGKVRRLPYEFEQLTGRPHASYFFYLGYGRPLPIDWVTMLGMEGRIVHIALEPNAGLEYVKDDKFLHKLADDIRVTGARVFLRFASEMNGPWTKYHGDAKLYKEKFRLVARVMRERAPNVAMVWCPYTTPVRPMASYYPGDDAVDWVGVNMYSVTYHNQDRKLPASQIHPADMLDAVYDRYAKRKPIMIGEYAATHYSSLERRSQTSFAQRAVSGLYLALPRRYPRVKCINYFNGNNLELEHRKNNNYAVTQNPNVLQTYREVIASPYFLGPDPTRLATIEGVGRFSMEPVDASRSNPNENVPARPMPLRDGAEVAGVIKLSAWARHHTGGLVLRFRLDGKVFHTATTKAGWQTTLDTSLHPNGTHKLTVEAYDGNRVRDRQSATVKFDN